MSEAYHLAQKAVADLKAAIHMVIGRVTGEGMSNAEIGRMLGIYMGHVGHEGHIPRTLLAIMEGEGVVEQDKSTKLWRIKQES
jgi:hypothetical protein